MSDPVNTKRRNLLKGTAGVATAAIFGGRAPYVMSQEKKTLRYLGTAVNQSPEIAAKVKEDLGITLEYIPCLLYTSPSPRDGLLSRMPSSA